MNNMWCANRTINNAINVLIFLVAINFLHYGQLILPIICLLLFIGNKYKFNIKNKTIFFTLCLFAISFFAFSYKYGVYSVMGFCLPLAYYIGSNVKSNNENIKKLIYIIALGMACHLILNFIYDNYYYLSKLGVTVYGRFSHYDIWLLSEISTTGVATNYPIIIGCFYYLLFYERNNRIKHICIPVFIISFVYDLFLGRRTPLFIFVICFICLSFYDCLFNRNKNKKVIIFSIGVFSLAITSILLYCFNIFGLRRILGRFNIFAKFSEYGLKSGRLELLLSAIKIMPSHIWGGQEISGIIGEQLHDLWTDIFDYAGFVSFLLMFIYTTMSLFKMSKVITLNKKDNNNVIFLGIIICCFLEFMMEPIMTGASLFMVCVVIVFAAICGLSK